LLQVNSCCLHFFIHGTLYRSWRTACSIRPSSLGIEVQPVSSTLAMNLLFPLPRLLMNFHYFFTKLY
jgi:hypothetical protein